MLKKNNSQIKCYYYKKKEKILNCKTLKKKSDCCCQNIDVSITFLIFAIGENKANLNGKLVSLIIIFIFVLSQLN